MTMTDQRTANGNGIVDLYSLFQKEKTKRGKSDRIANHRLLRYNPNFMLLLFGSQLEEIVKLFFAILPPPKIPFSTNQEIVINASSLKLELLENCPHLQTPADGSFNSAKT